MQRSEAYQLIELLYSTRGKCQDHLHLVLANLNAARRLCGTDAAVHIDSSIIRLRDTYDEVERDLERVISALRKEENGQ